MRKIWFFLILITFILCLNGCDEKITNVDGLLINEVCTSNDKVICNEEYDYYDYIEFYNSSDQEINLKSFTVAVLDHEVKLDKLIIEPHSFQIVFFTTDKIEDSKFIYANFKLSQSGEEIKLYRPDGKLADEVKVPFLKSDTSYGRYNGKWEVINPSPLEVNENKPLYKEVNNPIFSVESGFYKKDQSLTLESIDGTKIYYTLDSSVPTKDSTLYEEPISITNINSQDFILKNRDDLYVGSGSYRGPKYNDKCVVVRAIAISDDGNQSEVVTKSYFVNNNHFEEDTTVISLVTDMKNLVDGQTGIYVKGDAYKAWEASGSSGDEPELNWEKKGREWERECNFTMFKNGEYAFSQDCGMRVKGYGGRSHLIKSFNIYARSCYGEKHFVDPIFEGVRYTDSLSLKYDRYNYGSRVEKVRDGFVQSLVDDRNVSTQDYQMVVVFLDGEYWETYLMMEKYTEEYIENHYNVDKDEVVIIKDDELDEGTFEDYVSYVELKKLVTSLDLTNPNHYKKVCDLIDISSLIDYYATHIYVNNYDFSYRKNSLIWKSRTNNGVGYNDGKWRFMMYDMDMVAIDRALKDKHGNQELYDYTFNPFTGRFLWATDLKNDIFINNLIKNNDFKEQFVVTFMDIANENFNPSRVLKALEEEHKITSGDMVNFFTKRPTTIFNYLAEYANLKGGLNTLTLESNQDILLNTISPTLIDGKWKGQYFSDFELMLKGDLENISYEGIEVVSKTNDTLIFRLKTNGKITIK